MQWIEVSVPTRSDEIDDVCAQLAELGAGGMVVTSEELASFRIFNPSATDKEIRTWIEKNRN